MAGIKFPSTRKSQDAGIQINWKTAVSKAGESTANIFAPVMPTTVGTAVNTTQAIRDIRKAVRSQRVTQRARKDSSDQDVKKSLAVLNSAFGDIEKGNYSLDKANRELYDDYDDETSVDFEMPKGDQAAQMSSEEIILTGNRGIAKSIVQSSSAQLRGMQGVASALINANIKSSRAIIDSTTSQMRAGFNALNTSIVITNQKLDQINQNIQTMIAFSNQNTIQFYQTAINMMNGMGSMMESLQNTITPTQRDKGRRFDVRNGFSPRAFIDYIKEGVQESMLGAMFGGGGYGDGTRVNPSLKNLARNGGRGFGAGGGIMGMVLGKLVPKSIENTLAQFDKSVQNLMETGLARIGEQLSLNPLLASLGLGNIFGNKREGLNNLAMGKYHKDALPWNGMAQKALVEVIPEYLASMETSMTALSEQFVSAKGRTRAADRKRSYDYNGGQFVTQKELRKQFESEYMDRITLAMKESMDSLAEVIADTGRSESDQKSVIAQMERLIDQRLTSDSSGPQAQANWKKMTDTLAAFGVDKDKGLGVINQITSGVAEAISQLNDLTHEVETTQNVYRNLNLNRHQEMFGQMRSRISKSGQGTGPAVQYRGFSKIGSVESFISSVEAAFTSSGAPSLKKDKDLQAFVISMMYSGMDEKAINDAIIAEVSRRHIMEARKQQMLSESDVAPGGLGGLIYRGQRFITRAQDRLDRAGAAINPYLERGSSEILIRADRLVNGRSGWDEEEEPVGNGPGYRKRSSRVVGYGPAEIGRFAAKNGYISGGGANAGLFTEGAARLGLGANPVTNTQQLRDSLASGKPVILGGKSTGYGSPYTKAGHVIAADKLQGDKARVLDPMTGRKSYYSLDALGAGTTHAWDYEPIGYGKNGTKKRKKVKAASTRYTRKKSILQSSEADRRGVEGIEAQAMLSQEDSFGRSQTEIDRDMNITTKLIRDMQREPPAASVEDSIIQSNNMVRAALGNVISFFNAGLAKIFGKEGFISKLWNSDARKKVTGRLFTDEDAIFGDQYKWAKEKLGNFKTKVGEEVGKGYDFLYDNTMQYLYGKDEEGNDIHYSQNAKWQNSNLMSQFFNRRYRADQKKIKKAQKEAEKNGTELPEEFASTIRDYEYGEADENDPNKIIRSTFDTATKKWTSFTAAQWGEELERRKKAKEEAAAKEGKPAEEPAPEKVYSVNSPEDDSTTDKKKGITLTGKPKELADGLQANISEASKKIAESAKGLMQSEAGQRIATATADAVEVVEDQAGKLKEDLEAMRDTVTGQASEEGQQKANNFKKSFLEKMKAAMPKALVAAGAGAALGTANMMSTSLLGAMFLPGGPVAGAVFGGALSLLSQTEAFKTFMFGKQDPETQKREGGLISSQMQEKFKKVAPFLVGGAVLGGIKGAVKSALGFSSGLGVLGVQLLPGGILGGALLGAGLGILKNSESFKTMLLGEKGEDGKRSGKFLSDTWNKASKAIKGAMPKIGKAAAGAGVGALSGAVLANAGFLPAMLSFGGPVGMGIMGLGLGIASSTSKFNEWMFGSEMLDENGNPTGKRYKDGFLSRVQNILNVNVIEPIATSFKNNMLELVDWTKDKITYPFRLAFGPILDAFTNIKDDIVDFVHDTFEKIGNGIMDAFKGAIKTVFSPITKIVGFVGKNIGNIAGAGVKLALTPLSVGLKGVSMLTSPKRAKEYAKYYKGYYTSGLTDKLKDYWAASAKDGNARTFGEKFNDIVDTLTGRGVIGDEFYETYNQQMEEAGEGHLGWRRVGRERKDLRAQRKQRRQEAKKWEKIDAERRKIINRDLGGREVELTDAKVKDYRRRFKRLGIDTEHLQSSDDILQLLYHKQDFQDRIDPNKQAKGKEGEGAGETPEQKAAREKTSEHQDHVEQFLEELHKNTAEIAGAFLDQMHEDRERREWQKRRKRLKDRAKHAGVKLDLRDDYLQYWDTDRLNQDTLTDFKLSGEKDIYRFMYNRGIGHADNAEVQQQIAEMLGKAGFNPSADEIPDVEGTPAPPRPETPPEPPKPKGGKRLAKKKGIITKVKSLLKKNQPEPEEGEEEQTPDAEDSSVGFGDPFFHHTPIGFGPGKRESGTVSLLPGRGKRVAGAQKTIVQTLLAKISNSLSALTKISTEQKDIQSAQLEAATQGEMSADVVKKKKGKSFGARIMSKFNAFTSWLGFNKKKEAADKEAAESDAARNGMEGEEEGSQEINVNVEAGKQEEKKKGLLGHVWDAIKGFGSAIGQSKVGSFLIKSVKTLGTLGILGTVGFTVAELVHPGISEDIKAKIDQFSAYINADDFSLGKMFTDIKDIVVQKAHDFSEWFTEKAYPWIIEKTGPVGQFFDEKIMPWLTDRGTQISQFWDETAWPFLKELPGKLLDGFVTTAGVVGDFISNNGEKIVGATATVVENIIEPMGKLVVDLFIGIGKGLWAYIQKKFNPFYKDAKDDISNTDEMLASMTGKNVNRQVYGSAETEEEAQQLMEEAGYKNSEIVQNADGGYDVVNRRVLGNRTAVDENNETANVSNGNVMSAVLKQGINLINPITRKATVEGLKLGGKAGLGGIHAVLKGAKTIAKPLSKVPIVGKVFKAGGGVSGLLDKGLSLGEKGVEKAASFFSGIAEKFGAKAATKAATEGAENAVEEIAEEVVEKGTQTVAKEAVETGVMATIKEILKKAVEATEKAATNGILEKAVESLGKSKGGVITKIIKKIVEVLNSISKVPAKFANKVLETLQGSLTKATGETAVGAGTAGISIAVMATISGVIGAIDAPNLFGVKAEDCTGGMRVVSAIFEALLSIPWVGTFLEAAMLILSFAFNRNLKQELATTFYEFVCLGDQEKIANLETSRQQMNTEREVYNKLHGTNLDADAYNDLENTTIIGKGLNLGKKGINAVAGLFGKQAFNIADSTDTTANLVKTLQNNGYTQDQINKMTADELKAAGKQFGVAGYGPAIDITGLAKSEQAAATSAKTVNMLTSKVMQNVRMFSGANIFKNFNKSASVNETEIAHTVGKESSSITILKSIDTKLGAIAGLLGARAGTATAPTTSGEGAGTKNSLLTNAFNSVLSVLASSGMIKATNISELKTNLKGLVTNSTILTKVRNTLQKLNPQAYTASAVGYGDADMYKQGNSEWGNMAIGTFPNGAVATMKDAGCGPTALAAVANQLMGYGPVSPAQMGAYAASNGYISDGGANAGLFTQGAANLGLRGTALSDATGVKASLMTGKPVIMTGSSASSSDPYTKAGHIVVADGIQGNQARVLDPMTGKHKMYDLNSMARRTNHAWSYSRTVGYGPVNVMMVNDGGGGGANGAYDGRSVNNHGINSAPVNIYTTLSSMGKARAMTGAERRQNPYLDTYGTNSVAATSYDATKYFGLNVDPTGIDTLAMDKNYEYFKMKTGNFASATSNYKGASTFAIPRTGKNGQQITRSGLHWILNTQFFGVNGGTYGNIEIKQRTRGPRGNAVAPNTLSKLERTKILAAGCWRNGYPQNHLSPAEKTAIMCNGMRVICGSFALATYLQSAGNFSKLYNDITNDEIQAAYNSAYGIVSQDAQNVVDSVTDGSGNLDESAVNDVASSPERTKGLFNKEELEAYKKWKDEQDKDKGFFGKTVSGFSLLAKIIKAKINSILNGTNFYDELASITQDETDAMYGVTSTDNSDGNNAVSINYTSDGAATVNIAGNNTKEKIWNYLTGSGLTKFAASGVMGCWERESSNNPETLEGYYLTSTPTKQIIASSASLDKFATDVLFPAYARSNISINKKAYKGENGHYYPGLGLAQWTGPRGYNLFKFAQDNKYNWGEVGPQLKFYQTEFDKRKGLKQKMNSATSPRDATIKFFDGFEMYDGWAANHPDATNKRAASAQGYYDLYRNLTPATTSLGNGPGPGKQTDMSEEEIRRASKSLDYAKRNRGRMNPIGFGPEDGTTEGEGITPTTNPKQDAIKKYHETMSTVSQTMAKYLLEKTGIDFSSLMNGSGSVEEGTEYSTGQDSGSVNSDGVFEFTDGISARAPDGSYVLENDTLTQLKGNDRDRYLAAATSQLGYLEKADASKGRKGFTVNPGHNSVNKYTKEMIGGDYHWCACFAAWCAKAAGIPSDVVWQSRSSAGCTQCLAHARENGTFYARGTYIPSPGDQILFYWNGTNSPKTHKDANHIGIVEYVEGNYVHTIEGNSNDKCQRLKYKLDDNRIIGYIHPKWTGQFATVNPSNALSLGYGEGDEDQSTIDVNNMTFGERMNFLGTKIAEIFGKTTGMPTSGFTTVPIGTQSVNNTTGGDFSDSVTGDSSIVTGTEAEKTIWQTLRRNGFNSAGAAGVMGNLYAESGLRSNNLQNSYEKKLGFTDDSYTSAVDRGTYSNFVKDKAGYGLAQWTYWSRKQNLLNFAKQRGKSIGDTAMQTEFLLNELQSYGLLDALKSASSVRSASNDMMLKFEKPANQSEENQRRRASFGQGFYDKYASLGFGPGRATGAQIESPAAREQQRERLMTEFERPYHVDPKEFKALGFGDGMKVDAGFDMGSTDSRLDRIAGIMTEWFDESRRQGAASSAQTQAQSTVNNVTNNVNNNAIVTGAAARGTDTMKPEAYKQSMLRQHRVLSGRVNARRT